MTPHNQENIFNEPVQDMEDDSSDENTAKECNEDVMVND